MCRVLAPALVIVSGALALVAGPPPNLKQIVDASDRIVLARVLAIKPTGQMERSIPRIWGKIALDLVKCRLKVQVLYDLTVNSVSVNHFSIDALSVSSLCDVPLQLKGARTVIMFLKRDQERYVLATTLELSIIQAKPYKNSHWIAIRALRDEKERYGYAILARWSPIEWPKHSWSILRESLELQSMLGWRRYMKITAIHYKNTYGSERDRLVASLGVNGVCLAELQQALRSRPINGMEKEFTLLDTEEAERFADAALEVMSVNSRADLERKVLPLDGNDLLHWYACVSFPEVATMARSQLRTLYGVAAESMVCPPCR